MPTPADARNRASMTYNAAADTYDAAPLSFWDHFGSNTVERLHLRSGHQVLDVACGSGASAIPAAEAVAPAGTVKAIDLAENLLQLARAKALNRNLNNIQFELGDMMALNFAEHSFDAVVCVFGIFFVPDMVAATHELWRMVKPNGKLAITTWGGNLFEPANAAFWNSIKEVRPDLERAFNPWDRISAPGTIREMMHQAGIGEVNVEIENRWHPIKNGNDWWSIVCGSGYRGTLEQLTPVESEIVQRANLNYIDRHGIDAVQTNALYAVAQKDSRNS